MNTSYNCYNQAATCRTRCTSCVVSLCTTAMMCLLFSLLICCWSTGAEPNDWGGFFNVFGYVLRILAASYTIWKYNWIWCIQCVEIYNAKSTSRLLQSIGAMHRCEFARKHCQHKLHKRTFVSVLLTDLSGETYDLQLVLLGGCVLTYTLYRCVTFELSLQCIGMLLCVKQSIFIVSMPFLGELEADLMFQLWCFFDYKMCMISVRTSRMFWNRWLLLYSYELVRQI